MALVQRIVLTSDKQKFYPIVHMTQNDTDRLLECYLDDYIIPENSYVRLYIQSPQEKISSTIGEVVGNELARFALNGDQLKEFGMHSAQLAIASESHILKSFVFTIEVEQAVSHVPIQEDDESNIEQILTQMDEMLNSVVESAEKAEESAEKAKTVSQHYPIIGSNGNWFVWSVEDEDYIDTGSSSRPKYSEEYNSFADLPEIGVEGIIYLVKNPSSESAQNDEEYIWLVDHYEKLGTHIDLTGYATHNWVETYYQPKTDIFNDSGLQAIKINSSSNVSSGAQALADGYGTKALHDYSHASGYETETTSPYQSVRGKFNETNVSGIFADVVGWGTASEKKNIYALDTEGNIHITGAVIAECDMNSTGGKRLATEEFVKTVVEINDDTPSMTLDEIYNEVQNGKKVLFRVQMVDANEQSYVELCEYYTTFFEYRLDDVTGERRRVIAFIVMRSLVGDECDESLFKPAKLYSLDHDGFHGSEVPCYHPGKIFANYNSLTQTFEVVALPIYSHLLFSPTYYTILDLTAKGILPWLTVADVNSNTNKVYHLNYFNNSTYTVYFQNGADQISIDGVGNIAFVEA